MCIRDSPENLEFLKAFRAVLDEYGAATSVGEVGDGQRGSEIQAAYTSGGDKIHMAYDFDLLSNIFPTGTHVAEVMENAAKGASDGWPCWAYSNHDVMRHTSRWNLSPEAHRIYAALLLSLRGTACLYQGEELGLTEAYVAFEDLQDPYGKRFWPKFKGRDGCRTPIPWNADRANGGFSDGQPWLPVAMEHVQAAADTQDASDTSMLNFYRDIIAFRKGFPALLKGAFDLVEARDDFISFERRHGNVRLFCAFNLSDTASGVAFPEGAWSIESNVPFAAAEQDADGETELQPWQALFATAQG